MEIKKREKPKVVVGEKVGNGFHEQRRKLGFYFLVFCGEEGGGVVIA